MIIGTLEIKLYAPWVHTLKEKRMVIKSLIAKISNKFNVSIADHDIHQSIILGIACVAGSTASADSVMDNVISFIENNTEAIIIDILRK